MTTETARQPASSDPHLLDGAKLAQVGIQILNRYDLNLQCMKCGETWAPHPLPDGRLPRGYWKCPNRCNW